jgi:type I restriction enzyme R subunit
VDTDDADAGFLTRNYPTNYFSHIVIDECHRSAWGKWSAVLMRNPNAVQIGLTATPRQIEISEKTAEAQADAHVHADNLKHFGELVYEYGMGQATDDGYLAACDIIKRDIFLDRAPQNEQTTGVPQSILERKKLRDANTGDEVAFTDVRERYEANGFEVKLLLPERVAAMCGDLFTELLATGGPQQKTVIFCASDRHADAVANKLNNLYAAWCAENGHALADFFAFKCTAASDGGDYLPDLRGSTRSHFIATTVDLLSTGVDVPVLRNIVFFRYVKSPISFHQMVGRGTRLDPTTGKLMFRVYDYTNATRLFSEDFVTRFASRKLREQGEPVEPEPTIEVAGFDVRVSPAGRFILVSDEKGRAIPVTVEVYRERLAAKLKTPDVRAAGGLAALQLMGKPPAELLSETKERVFTA